MNVRRRSTAAVAAVAVSVMALPLDLAAAQSAPRDTASHPQVGLPGGQVSSPVNTSVPEPLAHGVQPSSVHDPAADPASARIAPVHQATAPAAGGPAARAHAGGAHAKNANAKAAQAKAAHEKAAKREARREKAHHQKVHHARVHAFAHTAGDPSATIADFKFAPASITIHVGDTITWTNHGPSSHTATAANGSFDTGILKPGASASHTFTHAGTIAYVCQIHPFMHGTVVVLASSTPPAPAKSSSPPTTSTPAQPSTPSPTPSAGGSATTATTPPATAPQTSPTTSSTPSLPMTGYAPAPAFGLGIVLLGCGFGLRRALARRRSFPESD